MTSSLTYPRLAGAESRRRSAGAAPGSESFRSGAISSARVLLAVWPAAFLAASASAAGAQQQGVGLRLVPDSVIVGDSAVRSVVLLENGLGRPITNAVLEAWTNDDVDVDLDASAAGPIDTAATWTTGLTVRPGRPILRPATVWLRVDYTTAGGSTTRVSAVATLRVFPRPPPRFEDVASVERVSSLSTLTDRRSGTVYLVVENTSATPLEVGPIEVRRPEFITPDSADVVAFTLSAHTSRSVPIDLSVGRRVRPGKHVVVFEVPLAWESASGREQATFVHSQELDIGVLAESEVLKWRLAVAATQ